MRERILFQKQSDADIITLSIYHLSNVFINFPFGMSALNTLSQTLTNKQIELSFRLISSAWCIAKPNLQLQNSTTEHERCAPIFVAEIDPE